MSTHPLAFRPRPRDMQHADFMATFGGVYEHSPWIAETLYSDGLRERHDDVDGLAQALAHIVDTAGVDRGLALINAHPDLAGKAAVAGELTAESTSEQSAAGIQQCTPEEFERFNSLNDRYKRRFGMTFVMAVRFSNRHEILDAFERRLEHDANEEYQQAITEIHQIAYWRLETIAAAQQEETPE
ncbi:MAG: 2-oxo-4-hydroxy-4-carboxy-5-ureidoimidazoline decarboxylase [Pseudomonadota bacterium]